ncbi:LOW QUALITY PROTEIN: baculoviral IAP repeat-containing protein 1 [Morphnus guianensis]
MSSEGDFRKKITAKEDPTVGTNNHEIHELNPALQACFLHVAFGFHKFAKDMEAEFQEVRGQLQKSYNPTMRSEHNRLKSLSYTSHSSWSLTEMAAAGFYHMLVKCSVQWFCCGLVLFTMKARCTPYEQHKKFCPACEFVLDKEVGNISKYNIHVQKLKKNPAEYACRHNTEDTRLQSFEGWLLYARGTKPDSRRAALFFTGNKDTVHCFACGGCLGNQGDADDPWTEHAKWFPECDFLQSKKSSEEIKKYVETYSGFVEVGRHFTASFIKNNSPTATGGLLFEDEEVLDSFKTWPAEAHVEATALAIAGFFHTEGNSVQCFKCAGCLQECKEGEDPMEGHAEWFPDSNCSEVLGKLLEEQPESPSTLQSAQANEGSRQGGQVAGSSSHQPPCLTLLPLPVAVSSPASLQTVFSAVCVKQTPCKANLEEKETLHSVGDACTELLQNSTIIFQFLRGKPILLSSFLSPQKSKLHFFQDYPESLSSPSSFQVALQGTAHKQEFNISEIGACYSSLEMPAIDWDYAPVFTLFNDMAQKMKEEKNINSFFSLIERHVPDSICPFLITTGKMLLLKCTFSNISSFQEADLRNLMMPLSVSDYIELQLNNSPGSIEVIPVIEQYKEHFKKCSLYHLNLSIAEQELLLLMSFVECLEIDKKEMLELLFSNLDKFICLEELSVSQCKNCCVFDTIPDGFKNLCNLKKLLMRRMKLENSSRLGKVHFKTRCFEFIKSSQNLSIFHLDCSSYFSSESLLAAISSCKKLTEINLTGPFLRDQDLLSLAAALPNCLKVLNLKSQYFDDKEACEILGFFGVLNLEELTLPAGKGIKSAAKLIVQRCLLLLQLRCFFILHLDDDSLLEIAKVANCGGFQKLGRLSLLVNHDVTETGWRNFFRTLNNMPALKELDISCVFIHQIKASAAFVQCVSLPGLVTIVMVGWLLDAEDLKMSGTMKEQHPQSRSLKLSWHWVLPLSLNFQD